MKKDYYWSGMDLEKWIILAAGLLLCFHSILNIRTYKILSSFGMPLGIFLIAKSIIEAIK